MRHYGASLADYGQIPWVSTPLSTHLIQLSGNNMSDIEYRDVEKLRLDGPDPNLVAEYCRLRAARVLRSTMDRSPATIRSIAEFLDLDYIDARAITNFDDIMDFMRMAIDSEYESEGRPAEVVTRNSCINFA